MCVYMHVHCTVHVQHTYILILTVTLGMSCIPITACNLPGMGRRSPGAGGASIHGPLSGRRPFRLSRHRLMHHAVPHLHCLHRRRRLCPAGRARLEDHDATGG